jgi:hypothetical protein
MGYAQSLAFRLLGLWWGYCEKYGLASIWQDNVLRCDHPDKQCMHKELDLECMSYVGSFCLDCQKTSCEAHLAKINGSRSGSGNCYFLIVLKVMS